MADETKRDYVAEFVEAYKANAGAQNKSAGWIGEKASAESRGKIIQKERERRKMKDSEILDTSEIDRLIAGESMLTRTNLEGKFDTYRSEICTSDSLKLPEGGLEGIIAEIGPVGVPDDAFGAAKHNELASMYAAYKAISENNDKFKKGGDMKFTNDYLNKTAEMVKKRIIDAFENDDKIEFKNKDAINMIASAEASITTRNPARALDMGESAASQVLKAFRERAKELAGDEKSPYTLQDYVRNSLLYTPNKKLAMDIAYAAAEGKIGEKTE